MGNVTPVIGGSWREGSGRVWHSTQNGNAFQWVQEGTGRIATGTLVSTKTTPSLSSDWVIHITFDGNLHWRLNASQDGNVLYGMGDNFTKVSFVNSGVQPCVHNVFGLSPGMMPSSYMNQQVVNTIYTENSGKTWIINSCPNAGYFTMKNQQDGRTADCYVAKEVSTNKHIVYIQVQGNPYPLRSETYDLKQIPLSNGDTFRCMSQTVTQPTVNTGYGISIGNSGISVSFTTPTTIVPPIVPPTTTSVYNPPMNPNYNPQPFGQPQPFSQPQPFGQPQPFSQPQPFAPPQPFGQPQPFSQPQPFVQPQVYIQPMSSSYGSLAETIINACKGKSFDSDKLKIVITYSTSQVSPLSGSDLIRVISLFGFESDKVKVIQQLKKTNNIASMDSATLCSVVRSLAHDSNKDSIIRELCPYTWDRRQNCEQLVSCLSFASSQNRLRDFILKN